MQKQVEMAVKNCFSSGGRYEKKEETSFREERTANRSERVREVNKNPFNNNLPTLKVNEIDEV